MGEEPLLEDDDPHQKFQYHKDVNNDKTNSYTIMSSETLMNHISEMIGVVIVYHFELYRFDCTLFRFVFDHFKSIRHFEITNFRPHYNIYDRDDNLCVRQYFLQLNSDTKFTPSTFIYSKSKWFYDVTAISLNLILKQGKELDFHYSLPNLTALTVIGNDLFPRGHRCNSRLHKLHIHFTCFRCEPLSDSFDTSALREVAVRGSFKFYGTFSHFSHRNLANQYLQLSHFCIRLNARTRSISSIAKLGSMTHSTLGTLIITRIQFIGAEYNGAEAQKPTMRVDNYDLNTCSLESLISCWISMIDNVPPRILTASELKEVRGLIDELERQTEPETRSGSCCQSQNWIQNWKRTGALGKRGGGSGLSQDFFSYLLMKTCISFDCSSVSYFHSFKQGFSGIYSSLESKCDGSVFVSAINVLFLT